MVVVLAVNATRWLMAGLLLGSVFATGCFSKDPAPMDAGDSAPVEGNATAPLREMYLVATDLGGYGYPQSWFKMRPERFDADAGETLNLTFKNALGNQDAHSLVISGLGVKIGPLGPGAAESLELTLEAAGTYAYYCDIGQHRALGMEGQLVVG